MKSTTTLEVNPPSSTVVQLIPINDIQPDPDQPRRTFNLASLNEMAKSMKIYGILQPLTLKVNPKGGYIIVFGERRWRAAQIAGLKEVRAEIIQASGPDVRILQLIENGQREDVHPMEQALSYKNLFENHKQSLEDISNKIGKSLFFVKQRLRLNELIPKWQRMFLKNGIKLSDALRICVLSKEAQLDLYDSQVDKEDEKKVNPYIQINSYQLEKYSGLLTEATFDIKDPDLCKKTGACIVCPFNSATSSLFPDDEKHPRCNNILCFREKTDIHFQRELTRAKEDPSVTLVYNSDYSEPDIIEKLSTEGHKVYKLGWNHDFERINPPQAPDRKVFLNQAKARKESAKNAKTAYNKAEAAYLSKKKEFETSLSTGKYKMAFIVAGDNAAYKQGSYIYVQEVKKEPTASKKLLDTKNATAKEIQNEIDRINSREERFKELDQQKIHKPIVEAVVGSHEAHTIPPKYLLDDRILNRFLLIDSLGFNSRDIAKKVLKKPDLWNEQNLETQCAALAKMTDRQEAFILHQVIIDKYQSNLPNTMGGKCFRKMAENFKTIPIADFEKKQNEIANKRLQRMNERVNQLTKMLPKKKTTPAKSISPTKHKKAS